MSHLIRFDNAYFFKGFFYWFGIEENPFFKKVEKSIATEPHISIKSDLTNIRKNYRESYSKLKQEVYSIEQ